MRALLRQRSGRWGQVGGQLVRTFHCAIGSVTKATAQDGRGRSVGGNLDYLDRTGAYADRAEDLVATGGRPTDEMRQILAAVDRATGIGQSRIAVPIVFELPAELSATGWRRAVTAVADSLEAAGYPTHWAIHRGHKGAQDQPHVHLVATPRPVRRGRDGWEVSPEGRKGRPAPEPALFRGREAVKAFRRQVAETINAELERERCPGRWHGGRLIDTGIERPAKKRLPQAEYHRRTQGEASPVRQVNAAIDAGDWQRVAASRRAWVADREMETLERFRRRQDRKERRLRERLARRDAVPVVETLRKAAEQAGARRGRREATEKQAAMIEDLARKAGLTLPAGWRAERDGGEMMAAMRAAVATAREQGRLEGQAELDWRMEDRDRQWRGQIDKSVSQALADRDAQWRQHIAKLEAENRRLAAQVAPVATLRTSPTPRRDDPEPARRQGIARPPSLSEEDRRQWRVASGPSMRQELVGRLAGYSDQELRLAELATALELTRLAADRSASGQALRDCLDAGAELVRADLRRRGLEPTALAAGSARHPSSPGRRPQEFER